jgi:hypothetical protein
MKQISVLLFLMLLNSIAAFSQNDGVQASYNKFEDETSIMGRPSLLEENSVENRVTPFIVVKGNKVTNLTDKSEVFLIFSFLSPNNMKYQTSRLSGEIVFLLNDNERLRFPINFLNTYSNSAAYENAVLQKYALKIDLGTLKSFSNAKNIEFRWAGWGEFSFNKTTFSSFKDFISYLEKK